MTERAVQFSHRTITALALASSLLSGCQGQPSVTLLMLDYNGVQDLVASHAGKIVVLDVWATT